MVLGAQSTTEDYIRAEGQRRESELRKTYRQTERRTATYGQRDGESNRLTDRQTENLHSFSICSKSV